MNSPELVNALKNISDRLQALEGSSGQQDPSGRRMSQYNGPHDEVTREQILRQKLYIPSNTTFCALQLPCGVSPPLGQMTETAPYPLKYAENQR